MATNPTTVTYTYMQPVTVEIPRTVTPQSSPVVVEAAMRAYWATAVSAMQRNGDLFSYETFALVMEALAGEGAITVMYSHDGEVTARTLFPYSVTLTADGHITTKAFCTFRREVRSFRLDRITCAQLLVMPGEMPPAARVVA